MMSFFFFKLYWFCTAPFQLQCLYASMIDYLCHINCCCPLFPVKKEFNNKDQGLYASTRIFHEIFAILKVTKFDGGNNMHVMSVDMMIYLIVLGEKGHFRYYTFGIGICSLCLKFVLLQVLQFTTWEITLFCILLLCLFVCY